MKGSKRVFAWILCAGLLLALTVSSAYAVQSSRHICCGARCAVCEIAAKTEALLRGFALFAAILAVSAILYHYRPFYGADGRAVSVQSTPVGWKVRLND